jgi:hypothetical protein
MAILPHRGRDHNFKLSNQSFAGGAILTSAARQQIFWKRVRQRGTLTGAST